MELVGLAGDVGARRGLEVVAHAAVVREDGRRGADLGAHVADGRHARARDRVHALALSANQRFENEKTTPLSK